MNYIRHLTGFFERVSNEQRLNPTHISLYMSLFQYWNMNRFINPISISRSEMMAISKICSKATYHKVMKELNEFGFIKYEPSYNPFRGSTVHIMPFDREVQMKGKMHSKKRTGIEPALGHYHTKNQEAIEPLNERYINVENNTKDKTSETSRADTMNEKFERPTLDEAVVLFASLGSTKLEAEKFFNHFESNGWKVGGRSQMKNWGAAAKKWILNTRNFSRSTPQNFTPEKNYAEPL